MASLSTEYQNVQNPALGATLIWRFACGYQDEHRTRGFCPLPLCYLVLPLLFHEETVQIIKSTRKASGLRAAIAKFSESSNPRQDLVLSIHHRAMRMRRLTTRSLGMAIGTGLIVISDDATIVPLSKTQPKFGVPAEISRMLNDSEKLGAWFALLTAHEVAVALKVRL